MTLLELDDVHISFDGFAALAGARLTLVRGERHGLVGANGCGKSTLLAVAGGSLTPDRGRVHLAGRDVSRSSASERALAGVGRTFQESRLWQTLSAREHLAVVVSVKRRGGVPMGVLCKAFGVDAAWLDRLPSSLTLLERRRLELVLAVHGTDVLLCDEVAAGLGHAESGILYGLIDLAMNEGWIKGAILVEHKLDLLLGHATRVSVMKEGRVVASSEATREAMHAAVSQQLFNVPGESP